MLRTLCRGVFRMNYTEIKALQEELRVNGIDTEIVKVAAFNGWDNRLFCDGIELNINKVGCQNERDKV